MTDLRTAEDCWAALRSRHSGNQAHIFQACGVCNIPKSASIALEFVNITAHGFGMEESRTVKHNNIQGLKRYHNGEDCNLQTAIT